MCTATAMIALLSAFSIQAVPPAAPSSATTAIEAGTANVPLSEVLRLHRELEKARDERPAQSPVAAVVERIEITGLLLDDAAELTAHVEARVLAESWAVLPLVRKDARLHVLSFPQIEGGTLATSGADLALIANRTGSYTFDIRMRLQAEAAGGRRRARVALGTATAASLKLTYDPRLFKLEAGHATVQPDGALLFPEDGVFAFAWEAVAPAAGQARTKPVSRPPVEPVVERARASVVSTLAGRQIVRLLFELKLDDARRLSVRIPDGYKLERIFLNGVTREGALRGDLLEVDVSPERAGDARGRLELLFSEEPGRFMLSGVLRFVLPAASWRTDEYVVELHLPEVFAYRWSGGSLSPCERTPAPAEFSSRLPTPGKELCLRQALAFEHPNGEVAYRVDLAGKYWAGPAQP